MSSSTRSRVSPHAHLRTVKIPPPSEKDYPSLLIIMRQIFAFFCTASIRCRKRINILGLYWWKFLPQIVISREKFDRIETSIVVAFPSRWIFQDSISMMQGLKCLFRSFLGILVRVQFPRSLAICKKNRSFRRILFHTKDIVERGH